MQQVHPEAKIIEAMKIWKLEGNNEPLLPSICNNGDYFAQLKKDGYWYEFEKTQNFAYLFSRNISKATGLLTEKSSNVPHIVQALNILPPETILIGEIYYPGHTSKTVTTIMGCLSDKAIQRQKEKGLIHYYIHDIIYYDGVSLINTGALDRYRILQTIFKRHKLDQFDFLELAEIVFDDIQERASEALSNGEEGMVLKKKDGKYSPGNRPAWATIKLKKIDYIEAVCIGFCDPTILYTGKEIENWEYWIDPHYGHKFQGKYYQKYCDTPEFYSPITKGYYYNWKTSMRIGAYDDQNNMVEIGTIASGLTDILREEFSVNPEKYLNRVVSLQCMEIDKKEHTLRHGFFKGFRDDKSALDCTIKEIF